MNYVEIYRDAKNKTRRLVLVQGNHYNFYTYCLMYQEGFIEEDDGSLLFRKPSPFQFLGEYDESKGLDFYKSLADKRFKNYKWLDPIDYTGDEYILVEE